MATSIQTTASLPERVMEYASQEVGSVLTPKMLLHLGNRAAIDQALSRLVRAGKLERAGRGIYLRPVQGRFGKRLPASAEVVRELGAASNETIVPSGAAAANALGLTTQVPIRETYLTSGRAQKLTIGKQTVELVHAPKWQLLFANRAAGTAIRALVSAGPKGAHEAIATIRKRLPQEEIHALIQARPSLPSWLASEVSSLVQE